LLIEQTTYLEFDEIVELYFKLKTFPEVYVLEFTVANKFSIPLTNIEIHLDPVCQEHGTDPEPMEAKNCGYVRIWERSH
jgi:hypothetical protein